VPTKNGSRTDFAGSQIYLGMGTAHLARFRLTIGFTSTH